MLKFKQIAINSINSINFILIVSDYQIKLLAYYILRKLDRYLKHILLIFALN